jgi:hypothetical protein
MRIILYRSEKRRKFKWIVRMKKMMDDCLSLLLSGTLCPGRSDTSGLNAMILLTKDSLPIGLSTEEQSVMVSGQVSPRLLGPWAHPIDRLLRFMPPTETALHFLLGRKSAFPIPGTLAKKHLQIGLLLAVS